MSFSFLFGMLLGSSHVFSGHSEEIAHQTGGILIGAWQRLGKGPSLQNESKGL